MAALRMAPNAGPFPETLTRHGRIRVLVRLARDIAWNIGVIVAVPIVLVGLTGLAVWVWRLP